MIAYDREVRRRGRGGIVRRRCGPAGAVSVRRTGRHEGEGVEQSVGERSDASEDIERRDQRPGGERGGG